MEFTRRSMVLMLSFGVALSACQNKEFVSDQTPKTTTAASPGTPPVVTPGTPIPPNNPVVPGNPVIPVNPGVPQQPPTMDGGGWNSQTFYGFGGWIWGTEWIQFFRIYFLQKTIGYVGISDQFTEENAKYQRLLLKGFAWFGFRHIVLENDLPPVEFIEQLPEASKVKWLRVADEQSRTRAFACAAIRALDGPEAICNIETLNPLEFAQRQEELSQQEAHEKILFIGHDRDQSKKLRLNKWPELLSVMMVHGRGEESSNICPQAECPVQQQDTRIARVMHHLGKMYVARTKVLYNVYKRLDFSHMRIPSERGSETIDLVGSSDLVFYVDRVHALQ